MQKMTDGKIYEGQVYSFFISGEEIGHGGNGSVYDAKVEKIDYPVVVKFFNYDGRDKEKRYNRFKKDIKILNDLNDIDGVMKILDSHCPTDVPSNKDEAWYLMPKGKLYRLNHSSNLCYKIKEMLSLASIIKIIHSKGLAHRDIKPENILLLNRKITLSDFGLFWGLDEQERLTMFNDKIGPYKIMPPELESIDVDIDRDYRFSDVYLFSKVLWMRIKEDNLGFRGQYSRSDAQIYLDKDKYEVKTLEPIHKLLEQATSDDMNKRPTIDECITLLELQCDVINGHLLTEDLNRLVFEEERQRAITMGEPIELVYGDKKLIYETLDRIISVSKVYIQLHNNHFEKMIEANNFSLLSDDICSFAYYFNGKKKKEYILKINKMIVSKETDTFSLILENIKNIDSKYISFSESLNDFSFGQSHIYLSSNEKVIIKK